MQLDSCGTRRRNKSCTLPLSLAGSQPTLVNPSIRWQCLAAKMDFSAEFASDFSIAGVYRQQFIVLAENNIDCANRRFFRKESLGSFVIGRNCWAFRSHFWTNINEITFKINEIFFRINEIPHGPGWETEA